ncbi:hypothetical protein EV182_001111 [Spiromyces aspiralis]|uniref:Uncharacterized protein n=1 Tax=Spiromyces aspiralis TaxID=68401 RepID=A0ACC1HTJ3_9FUNG|nr:hypothetical protein EV182_001111 [Spiromyces aspiralis]
MPTIRRIQWSRYHHSQQQGAHRFLPDSPFDSSSLSAIVESLSKSLSSHLRAELAGQLLLDVPSPLFTHVVAQLSNLSRFDFVSFLPYNLVVQIFSHLSYIDIATKVALVCKSWHSISRDSMLWKYLFYKQGWRVDEVALRRRVAKSRRRRRSFSSLMPDSAPLQMPGQQHHHHHNCYYHPSSSNPPLNSRDSGIGGVPSGSSRASLSASVSPIIGQTALAVPASSEAGVPPSSPEVPSTSRATALFVQDMSGLSSFPDSYPTPWIPSIYTHRHQPDHSTPGIQASVIARNSKNGNTSTIGSMINDSGDSGLRRNRSLPGSPARHSSNSGSDGTHSSAGTDCLHYPRHRHNYISPYRDEPAPSSIHLPMLPSLGDLSPSISSKRPRRPVSPAMLFSPQTSGGSPGHYHCHRDHGPAQQQLLRSKSASTPGSLHQNTPMLPAQPPHNTWSYYHHNSVVSQAQPPVIIDWKKVFRQRLNLARNWQRGSFKSIQWQRAHEDSIYCLQFTPDGRLFTGGRDCRIYMWDMSDPGNVSRQRSFRGHRGSVLCLQYEDNTLISGSSDSTAIVWDIGSGRKLHVLRHDDSVLSLRFNDRYLVTCSKDQTIKVWDRQTFAYLKTLRGHRIAVNALQLVGDQIVSASGDRTIRLWDIPSGECLLVLPAFVRGFACVDFDGELIAAGSSDSHVRVWDVHTKKLLLDLAGHTDLVRSVAFNQRLGILVSGSYDQTIKVWNLRTGELLHSLEGCHMAHILKVQFSDTKIVSCSQDQSVAIWDFAHDVKYAHLFH